MFQRLSNSLLKMPKLVKPDMPLRHPPHSMTKKSTSRSPKKKNQNAPPSSDAMPLPLPKIITRLNPAPTSTATSRSFPTAISTHQHSMEVADCILNWPNLDLSLANLPEDSFYIGAPPDALINYNSVILILNDGIPYEVFSNYHCHTAEYKHIAKFSELIQATTSTNQSLPPLTLHQTLLTLDLLYMFIRLRVPKDSTTRTAYILEQKYSSTPREEDSTLVAAVAMRHQHYRKTLTANFPPQKHSIVQIRFQATALRRAYLFYCQPYNLTNSLWLVSLLIMIQASNPLRQLTHTNSHPTPDPHTTLSQNTTPPLDDLLKVSTPAHTIPLFPFHPSNTTTNSKISSLARLVSRRKHLLTESQLLTQQLLQHISSTKHLRPMSPPLPQAMHPDDTDLPDPTPQTPNNNVTPTEQQYLQPQVSSLPPPIYPSPCAHAGTPRTAPP